MANGNVTRVLLAEPVSEFIAQEATVFEARQVLDYAFNVQEAEQRVIPLDEALAVIRRIAADIEARA